MSGSSYTGWFPPNGLGNLIVGYNELRGNGTDDRSGSHNIVVGSGNNFSLWGGLVVGELNEIAGPFAISHGGSNKALGQYSATIAGGSNTATGSMSCISGGAWNSAQAGNASIVGGYGNVANGMWSSILGGVENVTTGEFATVSGGRANSAHGYASSVSGGFLRYVDAPYNWRAGSLLESQ